MKEQQSTTTDSTCNNALLADSKNLCGWVSVKDKLPVDDSKVLIFECKFGKSEYGNIMFGYYYGDKWHEEKSDSEIVEYVSDQDMWLITHWMPLPEYPCVGG